MRSFSNEFRTRCGDYRCCSGRGFTLIELMVVSLLGALVIAVTVQLSFANQKLYRLDTTRTRLNQNLRSALDIIGVDTREAGENLTSVFPAVEIINGADTQPDEIILRRNLLDEVLNVCTELTGGAGGGSVQFALAGSPLPGCIYANQTQSYSSWRAYRLAQGGTVKAYLYDTVLRQGQFVEYTNESDTGTDYFLSITPATWDQTYSVGSSGVYMVEEWRYRVQNGYLQLIVDGDADSPLNVVFGIDNLQARALLQDGTAQTSFTSTDDWTQLRAIEITLTGSESGWGETFNKSLKTEFFPRNVLSN